jgi:uncharacterized lipoprotein YddW (UPF0748 family)
VGVTEPQIVRRYGDQWWMDPGEARSAQRIIDAVLEVAQRYDIDGVHLDDYFYPYPVKDRAGLDLGFPDDAPWQAAGSPPRAAWRRAQVDRLVERLHTALRMVRPDLPLGISPFGLPRPDRRPPGISGFSPFDLLYADADHWLAQGWLDYLAPQLYWPRAQQAQAFEVLLDSWRAGNPQRRHIWPGLYSSKVPGLAGSPAWLAQEIVDQIVSTRQRGAVDERVQGHAHFSVKALLRGELGPALRSQLYAQEALPPHSPWLSETATQALQAPQASCQGRTLTWQADPRCPSWRGAVLQLQGQRAWQHQLLPAQGSLTLPDDARRLVLRSLSRHGALSPALQALKDPANGRWNGFAPAVWR